MENSTEVISKFCSVQKNLGYNVVGILYFEYIFPYNYDVYILVSIALKHWN